MRSLGVSEASAAGILANIQYESGFDAFNATGDGGTSGGLFQHHNTRWDALKKYAGDSGRNWTDWHAQVDFALFGPGEAKDRGFNFNYTNAAAAAKWWVHHFEIPANADAQATKRAAVVDQYMFGDIPDPVDPYRYQFADAVQPSMSLPFDYPSPSMPMRQQQSAVFHNTFNISGSGSGQQNGIDLRRTVTMIADHLEDEMKTRMLRNN